jgi:branched-subunit amino acid aminotransferase/4-amino-4-deoxychorismate lyase
MIWVEGKILPDDALTINATDRTFEHGLGLFETLRTWGGRPTLFDRHMARMLRSAETLKLPIDPTSLPDQEAVRALLDAEGHREDRMLRITASGGTGAGPSVVWMRSSPLPDLMGEGGASVLLDAWRVAWDDPMAQHKTLNYWSKRLAFEKARRKGFDEALSTYIRDEGQENEWDGQLEGSRTNLFLIKNRGLGLFKKHPMIITASTTGPLVPGIMRRLVLKVAQEELQGEIEVVDELDHIKPFGCQEAFLTNSVRGIVPIARAVSSRTGSEIDSWPAPGPWTQRLQELVHRRLWPDGGESP